MIITTDIIHYGIAALLFMLASFCVTTAFSSPRDDRAEATLVGIALFFVCIGLVVGLRP